MGRWHFGVVGVLGLLCACAMEGPQANAPDQRTVEATPGTVEPVMRAADKEALSPETYDPLLGTYRGPVGCRWRITRSSRSLFALDHCTHNWRRLNPKTELEWYAGASLLDRDGQDLVFSFDGSGQRLVVERPDSAPVQFERDDTLLREPIRFTSGDITLSGTILSDPTKSSLRPAMVLLHGSGPQDRHGYASIIEFLAIELVEAGFVVLTYDKRGTGGSQGDWQTAGFGALAADATAAMRTLASQLTVDPQRVGLGGSSQAGWVAATAVADGAEPAFVFLLGAAGAATTVLEQNLYNTRIQMRCAGIEEAQIDQALGQQKAFFAARRNASHVEELTRVSREAATIEAIQPWLFPSTPDRSGEPQWYDVLNPDFDPLPVWQGYTGSTLFLFGAHDDSTDTRFSMARLAAVQRSPQHLYQAIPDAQHLGLVAGNVCDGLESRQQFSALMLATLRRWARSIAAGNVGRSVATSASVVTQERD